MLRLAFRVLLAASLCLLFTDCAGYHVGANKPTFMEGVRTVAVPTVRNETLVPHIETLVTDSIDRQLMLDGVYKITDNLNDSDAVLECEIMRISRTPGRSVLGDVQATQEFNMTLTIHYRVIRKATGEIVDDRTTNGTTSFFVSGDVNQDEIQAIPLAAQSAGMHIASEISEGW